MDMWREAEAYADYLGEGRYDTPEPEPRDDDEEQGPIDIALHDLAIAVDGLEQALETEGVSTVGTALALRASVAETIIAMQQIENKLNLTADELSNS